ncbi:Com family DNA-binding transcriptional regulator [Pasteurellaceae bacterium HPA106]|nr:Com family DNA-binding transcriptional regulator [Spirabiliibacterium pneumoniae]MBE2896724.1 Com family DNA-binding transcriptional regulator [Spirabiliibacterium pneumoniae]
MQKKSTDQTKALRCPHCGKLLAKARNVDKLEIKCHRCKAINQFN